MTVAIFDHNEKNLLLQNSVTALLHLAQRRGACLHKLLHGTQIFEQDLSRPDSRCHHRDWLTLLGRCQQLASPELPFILADALLHNPALALSQSLPKAPHLAGCLRQLWYFRHQMLPGVFTLVQHTEQYRVLLLKPALQLGPQQGFILNLAMALLVQLIQHHTGRGNNLRVQLKQAAPSHPAQISSYWPCPVSFGQPVDALYIPHELWFQPWPEHHAGEFRAYRRACYQLNRRLPRQRGLFEILQRQLYRTMPATLSLEQAASLLGCSSSSVKRLLQQQGSSYAALADDLRCDLATLLLCQGKLSNKQLASQLGYSDEHNFRRAFKRWTGNVPSSLRLPVS